MGVKSLVESETVAGFGSRLETMAGRPGVQAMAGGDEQVTRAGGSGDRPRTAQHRNRTTPSPADSVPHSVVRKVCDLSSSRDGFAVSNDFATLRYSSLARRRLATSGTRASARHPDAPPADEHPR